MSRHGTTQRRHRAEPVRGVRGLGGLVRPLWSATGIVVIGLLAIVATAGGTYALFSTSATTSASVVTSGSAGVAVTSVSALDVAKLGPGRSVSGTFIVELPQATESAASMNGTLDLSKLTFTLKQRAIA